MTDNHPLLGQEDDEPIDPGVDPLQAPTVDHPSGDPMPDGGTPIETNIPGAKREGEHDPDDVYIAPGQQDKYDRNRPTDADRHDSGPGLKDRYNIVSERTKETYAKKGPPWGTIVALALLYAATRGKKR